MPRGIKNEDVEKFAQRDEWIKDLFRKDCEKRKVHGFTDPALGVPTANQLFKKEFKVLMNTQRMYKLRNEVYDDYNLDSRGRPLRIGNQTSKPKKLPGVQDLRTHEGDGNPLTTANRNLEDTEMGVDLIGIKNKEQGEFSQILLDRLHQRFGGACAVKVDVIADTYMTVRLR